MSNDWMPGRREMQLVMARSWHDLITANAGPWKIPAQDAAGLDQLAASAGDAYQEAVGTGRTPVVTERCNQAFRELVSFMRYLKSHFLLQPPLRGEDLVALGLGTRDDVPSAVPVPTAQPEADFSFPGIHLIQLSRIRPMPGGTGPDPRSDYGVRIHWVFLGPPAPHDRFRVDARPAQGADFAHSLFTRRRRELFDFEADRGGTVFFCLRYENSKGQAGPFGPVIELIVP